MDEGLQSFGSGWLLPVVNAFSFLKVLVRRGHVVPLFVRGKKGSEGLKRVFFTRFHAGLMLGEALFAGLSGHMLRPSLCPLRVAQRRAYGEGQGLRRPRVCETTVARGSFPIAATVVQHATVSAQRLRSIKKQR